MKGTIEQLVPALGTAGAPKLADVHTVRISAENAGPETWAPHRVGHRRRPGPQMSYRALPVGNSSWPAAIRPPRPSPSPRSH
jgi:hypothetical protein